MGIPSYFSLIIKEYPEIIKKLIHHQFQVDNFFIDSNSIVYDCARTIDFTLFPDENIHDVVIRHVIKKIEESGNRNILITERGASFGYNTLVSDMRSLPIMAKFGFPIVFDATHSVQQPGGMGEKSGGQREFVPFLARAAIAVGVGAIFIETHEDPDNAPSDGPNMVTLKELKSLLKKLLEIDKLIK